MFSLYTVYKKHDDVKIWRSNQSKIACIIANARIILLPTLSHWFQLANLPNFEKKFKKFHPQIVDFDPV